MGNNGQIQEEAGDEILSRMYLRQRQALLVFAGRIVGCPKAAEDIVQDSFARLCREDNKPAYPPAYQGKVLFKICRNACIDWLRKESFNKRALEQFLLLNDKSFSAREDEYGKMQAVLQREFDGIGGIDHQLLSLRMSEHLSSQEIGQRLGLSIKAVDCRWYRLVRKLRRLAKDGDFQ